MGASRPGSGGVAFTMRTEDRRSGRRPTRGRGTAPACSRSTGRCCSCGRSRRAPTRPRAWELARTCGINRSTAWRLLQTLEHHGLVERDPTTGRYGIGYAALEVAAAAGYDGLARRARPILERIAQDAGESVMLAAARRFSLVYVDQVDPPGVPTAQTGSGASCRCTRRRRARCSWPGCPRTSATRSCPPCSSATPTRRSPTAAASSTRSQRCAGTATAIVHRRVRGVLERRLGRGARPPRPPDGDPEHLGPEPAGDRATPRDARADGAARGARDLARARVT